MSCGWDIALISYIPLYKVKSLPQLWCAYFLTWVFQVNISLSKYISQTFWKYLRINFLDYVQLNLLPLSVSLLSYFWTQNSMTMALIWYKHYPHMIQNARHNGEIFWSPWIFIMWRFYSFLTMGIKDIVETASKHGSNIVPIITNSLEMINVDQ